MSENTPQPERTVYTVGHSSHSLQELTDLLRGHGIEVVADVRSAPYSKYTPQFEKESFRAALAAAGIGYVFLGRELGGRPWGDEYYDATGRVDYSRLVGAASFLAGIERVERGIARHRVALLCSEENPEGCHRRRLVGRVLARRGAAVLHIRGDGGLEPEQVESHAEGQLRMFGDEEAGGWKSTRPVSRRRRPRSSSIR